MRHSTLKKGKLCSIPATCISAYCIPNRRIQAEHQYMHHGFCTLSYLLCSIRQSPCLSVCLTSKESAAMVKASRSLLFCCVSTAAAETNKITYPCVLAFSKLQVNFAFSTNLNHPTLTSYSSYSPRSLGSFGSLAESSCIHPPPAQTVEEILVDGSMENNNKFYFLK